MPSESGDRAIGNRSFTGTGALNVSTRGMTPGRLPPGCCVRAQRTLGVSRVLDFGPGNDVVPRSGGSAGIAPTDFRTIRVPQYIRFLSRGHIEGLLRRPQSASYEVRTLMDGWSPRITLIGVANSCGSLPMNGPMRFGISQIG